MLGWVGATVAVTALAVVVLRLRVAVALEAAATFSSTLGPGLDFAKRSEAAGATAEAVQALDHQAASVLERLG